MNNRKIIVTGLHGFIGSRFAELTCNLFEITDINRHGKKLISPNVNLVYECDILDSRGLEKIISGSDADTLVHFVAKTHIDNCEKDSKLGKDSETWKINVEGSATVSRLCAKYKKRLIYLSTECVFDGNKKIYQEDDEPHPVNWYGYTKREGELKVMESGADFCILRSVLAFGHKGNYPVDIVNRFRKMMEEGKPIKAVCDQKISFTFIDDLVEAVKILVKRDAGGIYHYAGNRSLTPFELAIIVRETFGYHNVRVEPVNMAEYFLDTGTKRLKNAVLSSDKIKKTYGLNPSDVNQALNNIRERERGAGQGNTVEIAKPINI